MARVTAAGFPVVFVDRTLTARGHQHSIGVWLRRRTDEAKGEVLAITGLLADLADQSVTEARIALKGKGRRRRKVRRLLDKLDVLVERTTAVITQARCRANGTQPAGATRLVSLHEPDARPINKGQLGKGTLFGYKAQVVDNADGVILDYSVHIGNPSDTGLLRPAIERITALLHAPSLVAADRGYWDASIEQDLVKAGVTTVVIPRTGKPSKTRAMLEHADSFIEAVKWRTGCEGRISHLKRDCGWRPPVYAAMPGHAPGAPTACSPTTSPNSSDSNDEHPQSCPNPPVTPSRRASRPKTRLNQNPSGRRPD